MKTGGHPSLAMAVSGRLRPTLLAVTPPTGHVVIPGSEPRGTTSWSLGSWAPLLAHATFALWLRTPPAVEGNELRDVDRLARVLAPWNATRYAPLLAAVSASETRVFVGTCAADLEAALDASSATVAAALSAPRLAGFIVRGDPDERALVGLRHQLDALGAARLAIGRSMHGLPASPPQDGEPDAGVQRGVRTVADFTVVAPFRPAITPKPPRRSEPASARVEPPLGDEGLVSWTSVTEHVVAMGGIGVGAARDAVALGAKGIAGIDAFFGDAARVAQNARAFTALFPRHAV